MMPLSYLDSFGVSSGMGRVRPLPILFICALCFCMGGGPHGKDFCHAGFAVSVHPRESQSLGKLTVGPAQDLKSNSGSRFQQFSSRTVSSSESLGSSPWVCAMDMFLDFVAKELH